MSHTKTDTIILPKYHPVDKYLSGRVVEPAAAPKVAKLSLRVETQLREAEERGTSSVPTFYRRKRVEVPSKCVLLHCSRDLTEDNINFHRTRV